MTGESWDFSTEDDEPDHLKIRNVRFDALPPTGEAVDGVNDIPKKSRFVLDLNEQASPSSSTTSSATPITSTTDSPVTTVPVAGSTSSVAGAEVKRGRFTVNDGNQNNSPGSAVSGTISNQSSMSNLAAAAKEGSGSDTAAKQPGMNSVTYFFVVSRFQVTSTDKDDMTPPGSPQGSRFAVAEGVFGERIELLVKQNELQRAMLIEVVNSMPKREEKLTYILNGVMSSDPTQSSILGSDTNQLGKKVLEEIKAGGEGDVAEGLRQVERMLSACMLEVGVLRRENEGVRRDNEALRGAGEGMRKDILILKSEVAQMEAKINK
jgi:hypothetical protein